MGHLRPAYLAALAATLRATAAAYGYTLSIATTSAILSSVRGKPSTGDVFLFVAGGLVAFAILEAVLVAAPADAEQGPGQAFPFAGALNFVSVAGALGAAVGLAHAVHSALAWLLAPLAGTAVYMLLVAAQVTAVSLRR
jgi:hypothetical protein